MICVVLVLATFIAYEPVRQNEFTSSDDRGYITKNPDVKAGLTYESIVWAFTSGHAANWHPLTWLSHMLDCELFGLEAFWHHLTNLWFHVANTLLLFWVLKRMTGAIWPSAFVAAAFALHPLHVESVAWAAERKDVLSGFFWMLTIAAYIRYAGRRGRYLLVVLVFGLGLMAKPMLVTLPFVLLLLDYWPLGRLQLGRQSGARTFPQSESAGGQRLSVGHLVAEKIPLFVLAVVSSVITYIVQKHAGTVRTIESLPLNVRVANALVSYISYIGKMIYPRRLAVFYPHPGHSLPMWQVIVCFTVFAVVSLGIIYAAKRWRYLVVGWLWYLGTLVPVIGLVQVGAQAMADRYTYLPSIGIFIMVAWGGAELFAKWHYRRIAPGISAGVVLVIMLICTRMQVRYWQNDFTLFGHALEVTKNNYVMHHSLGAVLQLQGKLDESISHYRQALQIKPNYAKAYNNLGTALQLQGKLDEAISHYRQALQIEPDDALTHNNLGAVLQSQGRLDEAITHFTKAVELNPNSASAHYVLAWALAKGGRTSEAVKHFKEALRLKPDWVSPMNSLAWLLATHSQDKFRNPGEAIRFAERVCELTNYDDAGFVDTLAAAYAAAGRFPDAVSAMEKAVELARSADDDERLERMQNRLQLYEAGQAYYEPSPVQDNPP